MAKLDIEKYRKIIKPPTEQQAEEMLLTLLTFADSKTIASVLQCEKWDVEKEIGILIGFAKDEEMKPTDRMKAMDKIREYSMQALKADGRLFEVVEKIKRDADGREVTEQTAMRQIVSKVQGASNDPST